MWHEWTSNYDVEVGEDMMVDLGGTKPKYLRISIKRISRGEQGPPVWVGNKTMYRLVSPPESLC